MAVNLPFSILILHLIGDVPMMIVDNRAILCVTPNPAVDRTLIVDRLALGEIHRVSEPIVAAGGKGLNVARVLRTLGGQVLCAGFLGGHSGRLVADLAAAEGLAGDWTWIAGETRTCVIVVEPAHRDATVINEPGPHVARADWARLSEQVLRASGGAAMVCLSGSLPPGSAPADYAALLAGLRDAGRPVWVDTSGPALAAALGVGGVGIKVNGHEAGAVLGASAHGLEDALAAARELHARTRAPVVLTLGGQGALLVDSEGCWHAQPPPIEVVSTVGSGDAFLAGLAHALAAGAPGPEALARAAASGSANACSAGGGRLDPALVQNLLGRTVVRLLT